MPISQHQARQEISKLIEKYPVIPKPNRQTITEAGVVHQFLDPMLQALGLARR
jgi:hypothetical protein